jgi:branched-chain amino acid transport system permease protein
MLQECVNIVVLWAVYLLFAIGIDIVWGSLGALNLAHGSVFMFSAFVGYVVVLHVRLPFPVVVLVCVLVGAAASLAIQLLAFGPIQRRSVSARAAELQILIASIGIASVPVAIAEEYTTSQPFGFAASSYRSVLHVFGGIRVTDLQLTIVACGLIIGLATAAWMRFSRTGLALRAVGINAETASLMGVDRFRLAALAMGFAGAVAGLAGALLTYDLGLISPSTGDSFLIKAFAVCVLGGVGSITGLALGSLVLAAAETITLTATSGTWVDAISFGVILLVLLIRPQGLLGRAEVRRT